MSGGTGAAVAIALILSGCLEPQVDDRVPLKGLVLPPDANVESVFDDPELSEQIRDNDNIDSPNDIIEMISGFAGGEPIRYWDFGPAGQNAAPILALYRGDLMGEWDFATDINIVDHIPGDPGYSPFWSIFLYKVTPAFDGEIIPSVAAMEEAIELGLVEPEPTQAELYSNCPIVHEDVRLRVGLDENGDDADGGRDGLLAPIPIYYRGKMATYFDFAREPLIGPRALEDGVNVPLGHQFVLTRNGEPVLSEVRRGVDITGDGDAFDTNDVLSSALSEDSYTPLRDSWAVTVPDGYSSIDTAMDQLVADFRGTSDMFRSIAPLDPITGQVVAVEVENREPRNLPIQSAPGGL